MDALRKGADVFNAPYYALCGKLNAAPAEGEGPRSIVTNVASGAIIIFGFAFLIAGTCCALTDFDNANRLHTDPQFDNSFTHLKELGEVAGGLTGGLLFLNIAAGLYFYNIHPNLVKKGRIKNLEEYIKRYTTLIHRQLHNLEINDKSSLDKYFLEVDNLLPETIKELSNMNTNSSKYEHLPPNHQLCADTVRWSKLILEASQELAVLKDSSSPRPSTDQQLAEFQAVPGLRDNINAIRNGKTQNYQVIEDSENESDIEEA